MKTIRSFTDVYPPTPWCHPHSESSLPLTGELNSLYMFYFISVLYSVPVGFPSQSLPSIKGGGFNDSFTFAQFHLHWGSDSSQGSEHEINSRKYETSLDCLFFVQPNRFPNRHFYRYAGELHLVHYNTKYPSFSEATSHDDGLAVLGIFLKVPSVNFHSSFFKHFLISHC